MLSRWRLTIFLHRWPRQRSEGPNLSACSVFSTMCCRPENENEMPPPPVPVKAKAKVGQARQLISLVG